MLRYNKIKKIEYKAIYLVLSRVKICLKTFISPIHPTKTPHLLPVDLAQGRTQILAWYKNTKWGIGWKISSIFRWTSRAMRRIRREEEELHLLHYLRTKIKTGLKIKTSQKHQELLLIFQHLRSHRVNWLMERWEIISNSSCSRSNSSNIGSSRQEIIKM